MNKEIEQTPSIKLEVPYLNDLLKIIKKLEEKIEKLENKVAPNKFWYSLKEA